MIPARRSRANSDTAIAKPVITARAKSPFAKPRCGSRMNKIVRMVPRTSESHSRRERVGDQADTLFGLPVSMPLVLDLDGTLIAGDLLYKSFFSILRRNPLIVLRCVPWLLRGRA